MDDSLVTSPTAANAPTSNSVGRSHSHSSSVEETLRQDLHRLTLKLESLKSSSNTEIEFLKDEIKEREKEHAEFVEKILQDGRGREGAWQERISSLTDDLHSSQSEVDSLKEQVDNLKGTVEQLRRTLSARNSIKNSGGGGQSGNVSLDHFEALQETLTTTSTSLNDAKETIASQSERLREYTDLLESHRSRLNELNEDIESKQLTILEQQERIRELESERKQRSSSNNDIFGSGADGGGKGRGNSLFSEVEERRVKVEDELTRLRDRVEKLSKENLELQATIERGDSRHHAVNHQLQMLQKSEEQVIKEFRQLKAERVNLFDRLTDRLEGIRNEYIKRLSDYSKGLNVTSLEVEKLAEERDKLILGKLSLERDLFEARKELKFTRHTKAECESHLKILRIKMQQEYSENRSPIKKISKSLNSEQEDKIEETSPSPSRAAVKNNNKEDIEQCKQQ